MLPNHESLRKLGAFSLADAEAGRKLVENLDRRRVRLQVVEMCWHFGIPFPDDGQRTRVKAFLDGLCRKGDLIQPVAGLYCRPDLKDGRASVGDAADKLVALFSRAKAAVLPAKPPVLKLVPPAPPPVEAPSSAVAESTPPEPPKPRPVPNLQRQTEWILRWLRAQGGQAGKAAMIEAAMAAGIILAPPDLDVPLQHLINRTRAYLKDRLLTLTRFGEQEAEYLDIRREALEAPAAVAPKP